MLDDAMRVIERRQALGECSAELLAWWGDRCEAQRKQRLRAMSEEK